MFGADRTSLDAINIIGVYVRPVHCFSGMGLHFLHPPVHAVEVSKGPVEELGGCILGLPSAGYHPQW